MPSVKIVATPAGEAPLHVREAWVGLILPLKKKFLDQPTKSPSVGVLSGPKSVAGQFFALITGRVPFRQSYLIDPIRAVEILEQKNPVAADWWRTNASHTLRPNRSFAFEAEVCEMVPEESPE